MGSVRVGLGLGLGLRVGLGASLLLIAGCRCTIHDLKFNVPPET